MRQKLIIAANKQSAVGPWVVVSTAILLPMRRAPSLRLPSAAVALRRRLLSTQPAAEASLPHFEPKAPSLATATLDWSDPPALSASLTDDENAMHETAHLFAQRELLPGVVMNRTGRFDRGIMNAFGQLGFLGLTAPVEYGGGGAGYARTVCAAARWSAWTRGTALRCRCSRRS